MQSWLTSHDPDFWEKDSDVCGLYLKPPENVVVWSVDEKSGMQTTTQVNMAYRPNPQNPRPQPALVA